MSKRIASASGTSTENFENIMTAIKQQTMLKDVDSSQKPFVILSCYLECSSDTDVYFNTPDDFIALGLNKTKLSETSTGSGKYAVNIDLSYVKISKLNIANISTSWNITILY